MDRTPPCAGVTAAQDAGNVLRTQDWSRNSLAPEYLLLALSTARMGVWHWDYSVGKLAWSPEMFDLHRIPRDFAGDLRELAWSLIPEEDRDRVSHLIQASIGRGETFDVEYRANIASEVRWMCTKGRLVVRADGAKFIIGIVEDITDRKRNEETLRQSEERFRLASQCKALTLYEQDRDLRYTWLYPAHDDFKASVGRTDAEILPLKEAAPLMQWKREVMASAASSRREICATISENRYFDVFITARKNSAGEVIGVAGAALEITEQKLAEIKLQKRNERLELLANTLGQLLNATDPDTVVKNLFQKVAQHLGVDTYFNFMVNEDGSSLYLHSCAGMPEDVVKDIQRLGFGQAIGGSVAESGQSIVGEDIQNSDCENAALVRGFGIRTYACNPLMVGGRLLGTLSFASRTRPAFDADELEFIRIISQYTAIALDRLRTAKALRESEERTQEIVDKSATVIYLKDLEGRYIMVNSQYEKLFKHTRGEVIGKTGFDLYPREIAQKLRENDQKVIAAEAPIEFEEVLLQSDGLHTYISIKFPLRDANGRIYRIAGISTDITERKKLQKPVTKARKKAKRPTKLRSKSKTRSPRRQRD